MKRNKKDITSHEMYVVKIFVLYYDICVKKLIPVFHWNFPVCVTNFKNPLNINFVDTFYTIYFVLFMY